MQKGKYTKKIRKSVATLLLLFFVLGLMLEKPVNGSWQMHSTTIYAQSSIRCMRVPSAICAVVNVGNNQYIYAGLAWSGLV